LLFNKRGNWYRGNIASNQGLGSLLFNKRGNWYRGNIAQNQGLGSLLFNKRGNWYRGNIASNQGLGSLLFNKRGNWYRGNIASNQGLGSLLFNKRGNWYRGNIAQNNGLKSLLMKRSLANAPILDDYEYNPFINPFVNSFNKRSMNPFDAFPSDADHENTDSILKYKNFYSPHKTRSVPSTSISLQKRSQAEENDDEFNIDHQEVSLDDAKSFLWWLISNAEDNKPAIKFHETDNVTQNKRNGEVDNHTNPVSKQATMDKEIYILNSYFPW